jgi:UDPglucose 6-dehydrogenase
MNNNPGKIITIIGAGYVGLSTAALFSNSDYTVYLIDVNKDRLDTIKSGKSFFYEQGIDPLIERAVKNKTLIPTDNYEESIPKSDIVFSCVGTPDNPDGSSNLSYVHQAAEKASRLMRSGSVFVQKSTVPVGTGVDLEDSLSFEKKGISYVSNPEFLREGTAISDSLWFDRVVVGGNNLDANNQVIKLYKDLEKHRASIAKISGLIAPKNHHGLYISTSRDSAELIKVTANAFLALKISFANSIAKLSDQTGADVVEVMDGIGSDKRIGRAFLNAGRGYGGGCFPKDVSGLIASAEKHGIDMPIMTASTEVNESMAGYIANKAKTVLGELKDRHIAVLGLSFKAGTSDSRRSPGIKLANILSNEGAIVTAYDPKANEEAKEDLNKNITISTSLESALNNVDGVFIATDWPEFLDTTPQQYIKLMKGQLFVDAVNSFNIKDIESAGLQYIGVGRG